MLLDRLNKHKFIRTDIVIIMLLRRGNLRGEWGNLIYAVLNNHINV